MSNLNTVQLGLSGQYKIEIKREGQLVKETNWFDNLVLDSGLDLIGEAKSFINYLRVGTGISAVTNEQILLDNQIAVTGGSGGTTGINSGEPNYTTSVNRTYSFAQGAIVGNITEVGISDTTTGKLFSRALITDINDVPISLTLLAIDQITIYYKLSVTPSLVDVTGTVDISGTTYSYVSRVARVATFLVNGGFSTVLDGGYVYAHVGDIGTYLQGPQGARNPLGDYDYSQHTGKPYVQGSYNRQFDLQFGIQHANFATGIKSVDIQFSGTSNHTFQIGFTPTIPKTATQTLKLSYIVSWGRG